jgi:hypothetical protein
MRKFILALMLLAIHGSAAFVLFRLIREARQPPTTFGWVAHVTTIAGDGAPAFRDATQPMQAAFSDPFGVAIGPDGAI